MSEKRAGSIKQAAIRALEPQLSELVKANRAEARTRRDELEEVLLGLQATLERESAEKVSEPATLARVRWLLARLSFMFGLPLPFHFPFSLVFLRWFLRCFAGWLLSDAFLHTNIACLPNGCKRE